MNDNTVKEIIKELREGFGIPLFYKDEQIKKDIEEGNAYLSTFIALIEYESDYVARMLLKNYAFYSYQHIVDVYKNNYAESILEWQFSKINTVVEDGK